MRSLAPTGMSLPGVGTGRCVRVPTERVDDAETGSPVRPGGAASSELSPASVAVASFRLWYPLPRRTDAGAWRLSPAGGRLPRRNRVAPSDPAVRIGATNSPIVALATMRAAIPLRAGGDTRGFGRSSLNCAGPVTGAGGFFQGAA